MVVVGPFLKLNAMRYTAHAYAKDLAIVIQVKYLSTVADMMQVSLRVRWLV